MKDRDSSQYNVVREASKIARERDDRLFVAEIAREWIIGYSDLRTPKECIEHAKWCYSVAKRITKREIERAIDEGLI